MARSPLTRLGLLVIDPLGAQRILTMAEIMFNRTFFNKRAHAHLSSNPRELADAVQAARPAFAAQLRDERASSDAIAIVEAAFAQACHEEPDRISFPVAYNADPSFAALCYAASRSLTSAHVVEVGVGYGVTSRLLLEGIGSRAQYQLTSIDLPPLSDPGGASVGLLVPAHLRTARWRLLRGSSRQRLQEVLLQCAPIDLFVSDGANVATLQRWELATVFPYLQPGGIAIFNNISQDFQVKAESFPGVSFFSIPQTRKVGCASGVVLKG